MKKVECDPLEKMAAQLQASLDQLASHDRAAMPYAIEAGRVVVDVKAFLAANPMILQSFSQWYKQHVHGHSLRSARRYEIVYIQVEKNRQTVYPNMDAALRDYRRSNPPRTRFTPEEKEAKEAERKMILDESPKPNLPPFEKISMGMAWWLASPARERLCALFADPDRLSVCKTEPVRDLLLVLDECEDEHLRKTLDMIVRGLGLKTVRGSHDQLRSSTGDFYDGEDADGNQNARKHPKIPPLPHAPKEPPIGTQSEKLLRSASEAITAWDEEKLNDGELEEIEDQLRTLLTGVQITLGAIIKRLGEPEKYDVHRKDRS